MYKLDNDKLVKINVDKVTLGTDPEFFIYNTKEERFISSCGWIGGTKTKPIYIAEGLGFQEDNVSVEVNVPPTNKSEDMWLSIQKVLNYVAEKHNFKDKSLVFSTEPGVIFDDDQLAHASAMVAGCDPDFNAWTKEANEVSVAGSNLRSIGFHVHVGYPNHNEETNLALIRLMDLYLGIPSVILDTNTLRKHLYGKSAAFRHQKYGVEYRTLSSYMGSTEELIDWIFTNVYIAIDKYNQGFEIDEKLAILIENTINENDLDKAQFIIDKYGILMPKEQIKTINNLILEN
jgi:hypothetical protein